MARVEPVQPDEAVPRSSRLLAEQVAAHGRATNMKRTLAHSPAPLFALMRWYDLHAEVRAYCGAGGGLTDDHVPPKCLLPKPRIGLVEVRACLACNGGA